MKNFDDGANSRQIVTILFAFLSGISAVSAAVLPAIHI
jgi:hypothetical protein